MADNCALKQKLTDDLRQAMKGGDTVRRDILRMVLAAADNAFIAKQAPLDDNDMITLIAKEVKRHQESIDAFTKGNRPDLLKREQDEMVILQTYMPQQMSKDEVTVLVKDIIAAVGAQGPNDKGKVMKELMPKVKGKADGKEVNDIVTGLLGL